MFADHDVKPADCGPSRDLAFLDRMLDRLEDRSAQLRVRAALALAFAVLAGRFGFAPVLGAFAAGPLVRTIDLTGRAIAQQVGRLRCLRW